MRRTLFVCDVCSITSDPTIDVQQATVPLPVGWSTFQPPRATTPLLCCSADCVMTVLRRHHTPPTADATWPRRPEPPAPTEDHVQLLRRVVAAVEASGTPDAPSLAALERLVRDGGSILEDSTQFGFVPHVDWLLASFRAIVRSQSYFVLNTWLMEVRRFTDERFSEPPTLFRFVDERSRALISFCDEALAIPHFGVCLDCRVSGPTDVQLCPHCAVMFQNTATAKENLSLGLIPAPLEQFIETDSFFPASPQS